MTRAARGTASAADAAIPRLTSAPIFHSRFRFAGWFSGGLSAPAPAAGYAICAIGNPASFRATLEEAGADVAGFETFRDHHVYTDADLRGIEDRAARAGAGVLLTTEKDAVKIEGRTRLPLVAARIEADIFEPGLPERIEQILSGRRR